MLMTGVAAFALAIAAAAGADTTGDVLTLNPVSHGAQTQASWRAQEGRPDSQGSAIQALVLQAPGTADTSAAALFRGFEGVAFESCRVCPTSTVCPQPARRPTRAGRSS